MNYKEEVYKAMEMLNQHPKTIFMGQAVEYKGTALTHQVKNFPQDKLLELPVAEVGGNVSGRKQAKGDHEGSRRFSVPTRPGSST